MATVYFEPKVEAVAQVATIQITAYDGASTYVLKVNGITIASSVAAGSATAAATALAAAWEASTHPYATPATCTSATDTLTFTGDVAEVRFTVSPSVSGGTGTIGAFTITTAATGLHTLDEPLNWSGDALPSNSDTIVFRKLPAGHSILWGLDQLSTTGHVLQIEQSFLGSIGLEPSEFVTSADGATAVQTVTEYRAPFLQLDCAEIEIGRHDGTGDPGGSRRLMIDNDRASGSTTVVHRTGGGSLTIGRPACMLKFAHASADVDIRGGSVGIGVVLPGETVTCGDVLVSAGQCTIGNAVTLSSYTQRDGQCAVTLGAATLAAANLYGGNLTINGDQALTAAEVRGGELLCNTTGTVAAVNHYGGRVDYTKSNTARTVTSHKLYPGGGAELRVDPDVVTITVALESAPIGLSVS